MKEINYNDTRCIDEKKLIPRAFPRADFSATDFYCFISKDDWDISKYYKFSRHRIILKNNKLFQVFKCTGTIVCVNKQCAKWNKRISRKNPERNGFQTNVLGIKIPRV